jgi:SAM-dependent methyltransferase
MATPAEFYFDPGLYDAAFGGRMEDVEFYLDVCLGQTEAVLELGAGSGRVTLPLAEAGVRVVAVDLSPNMLAVLRARLLEAPSEVRSRVEILHADGRTLALGRQFPLVLATFNVVGHLETHADLLAFLGAAKAHLLPDGELIFDTLAPQEEELLADPDDEFPLDPIRHPVSGDELEATERIHYEPETRILTATTTYRNLATDEEFSVPLRLRQWFPAELAELVRKAGFRDIRLTKDYGTSPDLADADMILVRARA